MMKPRKQPMQPYDKASIIKYRSWPSRQRIAGKRLFYTGHKPDFAALTAIYNDYVTPEEEVSKSTIWRQKNESTFGSDSSSAVGLAKSLRADCLVGSAIASDLPSVLKVLH